MKELKLKYPNFFKQFKENISIFELVEFFDFKELMIEINVDFTRSDYGKPLYCWTVTNFRTLKKINFKELERDRENAILTAMEEILKQKWI
jgi:hypothetical protein